MTRLYIFVLVALAVSPSLARDMQSYPSTHSFIEVRSPNVRLMVPIGHEEWAERVLRRVEGSLIRFKRRDFPGLDVNLLPLVLNPETSEVNAFVTLAPWRSEWGMIGALDGGFGAISWPEALSVHETRHVAQISALDRGFNRIYKVFAGEMGQGLGVVLSMPSWFAEGDAVMAETRAMPGGRGSHPEFYSMFRAQRSMKDHDFYSHLFGSYQARLPNHYVWGHAMAKEIRRRIGPRPLADLLGKSAQRSYNPFAFYKTLRKDFGIEYEDVFITARAQLPVNALPLKNVSVFPVPMPEEWSSVEGLETRAGLNAMIVTGLDQAPQLIVSESNRVIMKKFVGPSSTRVALGVGHVAITEVSPDLRWRTKSYSDLVLYDVPSGKKTVLTRKRRVFHPAFDSSGNRIVYLDFTNPTRPEVCVYAMNTRQNRCQRVQNYVPSYPVFYKGGISLVETNSKGRSRVRSLSAKHETTPFVDWWIGDLRSYRHELVAVYARYQKMGVLKLDGKWFSSAETTDSIRSFQADDNRSFVLQTNKGRRAAKFSGQLRWSPVVWTTPESSKIPVFKQATVGVSRDISTAAGHRFHSWLFSAPLFGDGILQALLLGDGPLRGIETRAGFAYDTETFDRALLAQIGIGLPTQIDLLAEYGQLNDYVLISTSADPVKIQSMTYSEFEAQASVPLSFGKGAWKGQSLVAMAGGARKIMDRTGPIIDRTVSSPLTTPEGTHPIYRFNFDLSYGRVEAPRDIFPEWSILIQSGHWGIRDDRVQGYLTSVDLTATVPLPYTPNGSVYLRYGHESQDRNGNYRYDSLIRNPRGYEESFFEHGNKVSLGFLTPLWYPDLSAKGWINLKRVSGGAFYDWLDRRSFGDRRDFSSYGLELIQDLNFFNLAIDIPVGLRLVNVDKFTTRQWEVEVFLGITDIAF